MKTAIELFSFEEMPSASPYVSGAWRTRSVPEEAMISVAAVQWEMVVTTQDAGTTLTVRGPETRATPAPIPQDAEFFGIPFSLGTFMPGFAPQQLVDRSFEPPLVSRRSFWLDGAAWELPTPDNADVFVDRLIRAGLLVHDPVVAAALDDERAREADLEELSTRTVERRVARATGLTRGLIRQVRRAERAVELLRGGMSPLDVVRTAGYADQPHLTRSLKRFVGQTPSEVAAGD
jgi:hypothetical protein